jgi:hypothetical protein
MRHALFATLLLLPAAILPAAAQTTADPATGARPGNVIGTGQSLPLSDKASNATSGDTSSVIAPRLPTPSAGEDASPRAFLQSAQRALTLGHTGEAQEALERAESRLLDRTVAPSRANQPSAQPVVAQVGDARRALAAGDRATTQRLLTEILSRLRD